MATRRAFLQGAGAIAAGMATALDAVGDEAKPGAPPDGVPDTLDLAEHGRLALNGNRGLRVE